MSLTRILEPEVMDTPDEARDYDAMDHIHVNRLFAEDFIAFAEIGSQKDDSRGAQDLPQQESAEQESAEEDFAEPLDIVDLGCGTAQLPIVLCELSDDVRVLAVDLAVHMLDLAKYNIEAAGLIDRIQLAQADAKATDFDDAMFAATISNSIVHHIPEPRAVLREAVRITQPGGCLFFRDLLRPKDQAELDGLVQQYAGGEPDHARQMFRDSLHAALSLAEIRELVAELGFSQDSVQATSDRHWTWAARLPLTSDA